MHPHATETGLNGVARTQAYAVSFFWRSCKVEGA